MEDKEEFLETRKRLAEIKADYEADKSAAQKRLKRIERDLRIASGSIDDHFTKEDDDIRGAERAKISIPVLDGYVRKMVSQYIANPYGINTSDEKLNERIRKIERNSQAKYEYKNALYMTGACGYGYLYVTTDVVGNNVDLVICGVEDSRQIVIDRNSKRLDGSDMKRASHTVYISVSEAKALYGVGVMASDVDVQFLESSSRVSDSEDCPVITLWEMRDGSCWITKIVGNKIVSDDDLEIPFVPVFTSYGLLTMIGKKMEYVGMIHKAIGAQQMIDYAASMTQERLALSPATKWVSSIEAIGDHADDLAESHRSLSPAILYNERSSDGTKNNQRPTKENASTDLSDVSAVLGTFTGLVSSVIGIESSGIGMDAKKNETAEAVLLRAKESESSIADIYSNFECTVSHIGRVLSHWLKAIDPEFSYLDPEGIDFEVSAGPMLSTKRKENLKTTMALFGMLGNDPQKQQMLFGDIAENADGVGENVVKVFQAISSKALSEFSTPTNGGDPAQMESMSAQLQQMQNDMNQSNIYIQQLQQENYALKSGAEAKVLVAQMQEENKIILEQMRQAGSDRRLQEELSAKFEESQNRYRTELMKIVTQKPKTEIISGARPDYDAVGGMKNQLTMP